ncbi:MAG: transpeptidase family protein, partial [Candidatus Sumerlaeaceae bacterium]|nr:transpeptidase family protein [Candidatus Sumerlaeaceae bacterium]
TGLPLEPLDPEVLASTYGHSVVLTIDRDIQQVTEQALKKKVQESSADAGVAVVYAVKTGEVLAMASVPSFSLTAIQHAHPAALRNRAITDAIEPGSVMKIFTYAAAIEEGKIPSFREVIDCAGGRWTVAGRTVVDAHGMGAVPIVTAFAQSSNVAAAKLAVMRLQPARFYKHLVDFGFGEKTGIDLPGEAPGLLRHVKDWTAQSVASLAYGYELQATAIQIAAAAAAIANNGVYMKPHVAREIRNFRGAGVKLIEPETGRRAGSPQTTKRMLELMEAVVREGTGKAAALPNYRVGGKTGTTIKLDPETKRYSRGNYISSFCGVAPLDDPELCIYIWVDNPRGGTYYGGQVAAPVFKEIAAHALKVLRIPPSTGTAAQFESAEAEPTVAATERMPEPTPLPDNYDLAPDTMPDLTGLTMAEATEILAQLNLDFSFTGSGVVVNQNPKPHETIDRRERIEVVFAPLTNRSLAAREDSDNPLGDQVSSSALAQLPADNVKVTIRHGRNAIKIPTTTSILAGGAWDSVRRRVNSPPTDENNPSAEAIQSLSEEPDPRVRRGPAQDAGRSSWSKIADKKREAGTDKEGQAADQREVGAATEPAPPARPVRSAYEIPSRSSQNGGER